MKYLLMLFSIAIASCRSDVQKATLLSPGIFEYPIRGVDDSTLRVILTEWRADTNGCLKLRSPDMALTIMASTKLEGKSRAYLTDMLGSPNRIMSKVAYYRREGDSVDEWRWLTNVVCHDDNTVNESVGHCWLSVVFFKNEDVSRSASNPCN